MKLFWPPEALDDRRAIHDHIETDTRGSLSIIPAVAVLVASLAPAGWSPL
ncbi:MAG: hypothetical protein ACYCZD_03605 [Rhodanobacter sp.]